MMALLVRNYQDRVARKAVPLFDRLVLSVKWGKQKLRSAINITAVNNFGVWKNHL